MSGVFYPATESRFGAVTLVIDDGPSSATSELIDALDAGGHRAVLFVLGCNIAGNERVLVDAIRRGFALGNHSFSHPAFSEIDVATARDEIMRTDALIDALYGQAAVERQGRWFRFPFLDTGGDNHGAFQSLLAEMNFEIPSAVQQRLSPSDRTRRDWPSTVLTRDWAAPTTAAFRSTVMSSVAGDVIEYHDKVETVASYVSELVDTLRVLSLRATIPAGTIKRVALVSWWLDSLGGMERHITEIACALVRSGVTVDYLSEMPLADSNMYRAQMEAGGVRVHAEEAIPTPATRVRDLLLSTGLLPVARTVWRAIKRKPPAAVPMPATAADSAATEPIDVTDIGNRVFLAAIETLFDSDAPPDVLHIHGIRLGQSYIIEWAHARGIPTVYTEHVTITELGGPFRPESPATVMKADALACVSNHARDSLLSILPARKLITVSNHLVRAEQRLPGVSPDPFLWICLARLEHNKGIDVLLRALALCVQCDARFRLVIAGDGKERLSYERLADELGIANSVSFRGVVRSEDLRVELPNAAGFVLASRSEAMPVSVIEAMAHGKAIVATRVGGIPELLTHNVDALLIEPDDVSALADAMIRMSTNDTLRSSIEHACVERFAALRYHEAAVLHDLRALYAEAISRG